MNLSDPFGRKARRDNQEYQALSQSLRGAGLNTREAANEVLARLRRRALIIAGAAIILTVPLALLFPALAPIFVMFAILIVAWALAMGVKAHVHIARYIREELEQNRMDGGS